MQNQKSVMVAWQYVIWS